MDKTTLNAMFDSLVHIGNKTNFWNTKMKPYIYGSVNGIHVINLLKTCEKLAEVQTQLKELTTSGKKVLIVATKIQSRDAFQKLAEETGSYYVCEKWVPGLLTNFKTIRKRINTYLQLLQDSQNGAFDILTKKEKAAKLLELEKLDRAYKGLKEMKKLPDVVLVSDGIYERQSLKEATTLGVPTFALFSTNGDRDIVTNFIPTNTNSPKAFEYIAGQLKASFVKAAPQQEKAPVHKVTDRRVSGEGKPRPQTARTDSE